MVTRSSLLDEVLTREIVGPGVAPAATAAVATRCSDRWVATWGAAGLVGGLPTNFDTPFDLASVTKPLFAVSCARLVERGYLDWEAPLARYLPSLRDTAAGARPIADHLSHRAGLVAHIELFAPLRASQAFYPHRALRRAAGSVRPGTPQQPLYSDLGYILTGKAVEQITKQPLDTLLRQELCGGGSAPSLGSSRQWRRQDPTFVARVAPTEIVPWRGGVLRGVVHDDNAWALSGYGTSGHAGLFGTARELLRVATGWLDGRLLSGGALLELIRPRPGGTLRMGFDGKTDDRSLAGRVAGPNTFGHLGYTGTSLWCDPDQETVVVLLTNRVNPSASNQGIRGARPRVHDELFQLAWNCRVPSRTATIMLPLEDPATAGHPTSRPDRCGS